MPNEQQPVDKPKYGVLKDDDEALTLYMKSWKEFDDLFNELMFSGCMFTLRLEVKGQKRKLVHCRVSKDKLETPNSQ